MIVMRTKRVGYGWVGELWFVLFVNSVMKPIIQWARRNIYSFKIRMRSSVNITVPNQTFIYSTD